MLLPDRLPIDEKREGSTEKYSESLQGNQLPRNFTTLNTLSLIASEQSALVAELVNADRETNGRPSLQATNRQAVSVYLVGVLADSDRLAEHVLLLANHYQVQHQSQRPRRDQWEGTPHIELLAEELADSIMNEGPDALGERELAALLLSPLALYDLAERIHADIPEWWVDPLAEAGRNIAIRYGIGRREDLLNNK